MQPCLSKMCSPVPGRILYILETRQLYQAQRAKETVCWRRADASKKLLQAVGSLLPPSNDASICSGGLTWGMVSFLFAFCKGWHKGRVHDIFEHGSVNCLSCHLHATPLGEAVTSLHLGCGNEKSSKSQRRFNQLAFSYQSMFGWLSCKTSCTIGYGFLRLSGSN